MGRFLLENKTMGWAGLLFFSMGSHGPKAAAHGWKSIFMLKMRQ